MLRAPAECKARRTSWQLIPGRADTCQNLGTQLSDPRRLSLSQWDLLGSENYWKNIWCTCNQGVYAQSVQDLVWPSMTLGNRDDKIHPSGMDPAAFEFEANIQKILVYGQATQDG